MEARSKNAIKASEAKTKSSNISDRKNTREQVHDRILYLASLIDNISDSLI